MQRKLVSVQTLRLLLNLELATFESCQGVAVQAIDVLTTADSDGCNWTHAAVCLTRLASVAFEISK